MAINATFVHFIGCISIFFRSVIMKFVLFHLISSLWCHVFIHWYGCYFHYCILSFARFSFSPFQLSLCARAQLTVLLSLNVLPPSSLETSVWEVRLKGEHQTAVACRVAAGSGKRLAALADGLALPEAAGTDMLQAVPGSRSTSKPLLAVALGAWTRRWTRVFTALLSATGICMEQKGLPSSSQVHLLAPECCSKSQECQHKHWWMLAGNDASWHLALPARSSDCE